MNATAKFFRYHRKIQRDRDALLKEAGIMLSRVQAILAVPEAVDALSAGDMFGSQFGEVLSADECSLREAIKKAKAA